MSNVAVAIALVLTTFIPFARGYAATPKGDYELQERCGKRAEEEFRREWGNGITNTKEGQSIASYRNHYNSQLNKCFYLLTNQSVPSKDNKSRPSKQITLLDINENKEYGFFFKFNDGPLMDCAVAGKKCASQTEWEALVAPYMGD